MNNSKETEDELFKDVKQIERRKVPSNMGLYMAILFFNLVMLALDIGSALSVYWATSIAFYAILTFASGFIPLVLHEILFFRPYASDDQKSIAKWGTFAAIAAVVVIAILAVIVNVYGVSARSVEIGMLIFIVISAVSHAIACAAYFYIDDGITAENITTRMEARAIQKRRRIASADYVLGLSRESINARRNASAKHGSMNALRELLRQMGEDDDGDGIPNALDFHDNRKDMVRTFGHDEKVADRTNGDGRNP